MTLVQSQELTVDGDPAPGVKVEIKIAGVPAATADYNSTIVAAAIRESDNTGYWEADLVPNAEITPRGTWYEIHRLYPASFGGARVVQYALVPYSSVPISIEELIVSEPDAPRITNSELTDHLAHINPHPQYLTETEADALYEPIGGGGGGGGGDPEPEPLTHDDITDFDDAVTAFKISDFQAPDNEVSLGNHRLTNLANSLNTYDAINKSEFTAHSINANDPHPFSNYGIMVGGGRRVYVQSTTPTGTDLRDGDVWVSTSPVYLNARTSGTWIAQEDNSNARLLPNGETTFNRNAFSDSQIGTSTGVLKLTFFTGLRDETISQVRFYIGQSAAAGTPTLSRIGVWLATDAGALVSLVASTANDTSLLTGSASSRRVKSFTSSWAKERGQRYAVGLLFVSGSAAPYFGGTFTGVAQETGDSQRWCGQINSQTDLPASALSTSVIDATSAIQFHLLN